MDAALNIKVISQTQSEAGINSSLPLPRSMMPLPKTDLKQQYGGLSNPAVQYQHSAKTQPSYASPSDCSGSAELLRGVALKNHLLQQKAGLYSHRRTDGTCSAYSSPQIPKRQVSRSKDTLDLRTSTLNHKALRDLQLRRNTNKNWTFGKYRFTNVGNAGVDNAMSRLPTNVQLGHGRGHLLYTKGANGNEMSCIIQKEERNISDQDLQSNNGEASSNKPKSSHHTLSMPCRWSEPGKVNMAAVAPFRYR